jgi:hypothetical protein
VAVPSVPVAVPGVLVAVPGVLVAVPRVGFSVPVALPGVPVAGVPVAVAGVPVLADPGSAPEPEVAGAVAMVPAAVAVMASERVPVPELMVGGVGELVLVPVLVLVAEVTGSDAVVAGVPVPVPVAGV